MLSRVGLGLVLDGVHRALGLVADLFHLFLGLLLGALGPPLGLELVVTGDLPGRLLDLPRELLALVCH